ncbi:MAG: aminotransferase class III-fold pyridoxal phosphate-dependent enzyme, partial [Gammaproteobacteria bacterium]|nr:aminotransferase class III-fold pyridoxal phosphate-dependent enzyme [Gammaproteobacteria bacterium]
GAAVSAFGHSHPVILEAIRRQLDSVVDTHSMFFTNGPQEQLAEHLSELSDGHFARSLFFSSGSEAVEGALKLARQYHVERGEPERVHVISRQKSYHGNTMGALSLSDASRGPLFSPYIMPAKQIPAYFPYRFQRAEESEEDYALRCIDALEDAILELGPETVSAFFVETVVGSSLGVVPTPPVYLQRAREICDRYGVLLVFDEVMCGAGRTGTFFAYEQERVRPDLLTMAKGLSGGHIPLSAVCATAEIYDAIHQGSGKIGVTQTYMGHPLACAAGLGVMEIVRKTDLIGSVAGKGERLIGKLRKRFGDHPHIDYIRGRGLFMGMEVVSDRTRKEPYPAQDFMFRKIRQTAFDEGLICWPGCGSANNGGDFILLAPPYIISDAEMDELVDLLAKTIDRCTLG